MNKKQQRRAEVLAKVSSGGISKTDAENLLGLGRRQIDRLLRKYEEGLKAVIHGNSGRVPVNKTPQSLIDSPIEFAGEDGKYHGLNACHLHDLLEETDEIFISRPVIYRVLRESGVIRPGKQKAGGRRQRRERASREGMLLQIDGSPHDWLCGRGPKMAMIGAIDDATGKIVVEARSLIESVKEQMELYYDERSEQWQQSERGEKHSETMELIEEIVSLMQDLS